MPKPATSAQANCTEAARAAALASHSAASLAGAAGFREAARLLRSAEALARAATAALLALPHLGAGSQAADHGATGPEPKEKKRRSQKKKTKPSAMLVDVNDDGRVQPVADGVLEAAVAAPTPALSPSAAVFVPSTATRVLAKQTSRERSPRGLRAAHAPALSSSTASGLTSPVSTGTGTFSVGMAVVLVDLISRLDLSGKSGVVKAFDPTTLRYAVMVDDTGESVRVLAKNMEASIVAPGSGAGFG